jgi:RNA polymerase sigma-32 factor
MSNALVSLHFPAPVALGSLDAYITAVNQVPMLTHEQESALADEFRLKNDLEAARKLVLAHLRFVVHVARGYAGYGLNMGDLVQEGNIGLMKAVKRFDPAVGVRLVSFAVHWIRAEMHEFILKNWRIVKVATTKAQRKLFFNLRSQKKRLGWMSADEVAVVAKELNVDQKTVVEMEGRLNGFDVAFDAPDDDDDARPSPGQYLIDHGADPSKTLEGSNWDERNLEALEAGLERLDPRAQDIIRRRWMADQKATLHELADEYKVSAERIRQIETQAMKKLKVGLNLALA